MNIAELKEKKISELTQMAKRLKVEGAAGMRKQELMFALLQTQIEKNGLIFGEGTLEILPDGFGFFPQNDGIIDAEEKPRFRPAGRQRAGRQAVARAQGHQDPSEPRRAGGVPRHAAGQAA